MDPRVIDLKGRALNDEQCEEELQRLLEERANSRYPQPPVTCLWLTGNRLTRVPPSVFLLTELESLYIGHNRLCELPREMARFKSLGSLGISGNPLCSLPTELANLRCLHTLFASASPDPEWQTRDYRCPFPRLLRYIDRSRPEVEQWMTDLRHHNGQADSCRAAVLTLLACKKYGAQHSRFLRLLPRQLVETIARHLWASRRDPSWRHGPRPFHAVSAEEVMQLAALLVEEGPVTDEERYRELIGQFFNVDREDLYGPPLAVQLKGSVEAALGDNRQ